MDNENVNPEVTQENNGAVDTTTQPIKTIDKRKFDEVLSEKAKLEKELKAYKDKDKTDAELNAEKLESKDKIIAELTKSLNLANINTELADSVVKLNLKNSVELGSLIDVISLTESNSALENAKFLNKILMDAYNKGVNDSKADDYSNMSTNMNGNDGSKSVNNLGAEIAKKNKVNLGSDIKNFYKKEK